MISRIENGKIVEEKEEVERLSVMMQLGMELKPKEADKYNLIIKPNLIWHLLSMLVLFSPIRASVFYLIY